MQVTDGRYWVRNSKVEGSRGAGSYSVEIYLDGELQKNLIFEVKSDGPYTENLITAFDQDGTNPTSVFGPNDAFYLVGDLSNAPEEVLLKAIWTAVDVEGEEPDANLGEYELSMDEGGFWFSLSPNGPSLARRLLPGEVIHRK